MALFGDTRLPARFWAKAQPTADGCWIWMGSFQRERPDPYGHCWDGLKVEYAHRLAYRRLTGPISSECLDHLCRNRLCVNPAHLRETTQRENVRCGLNGPRSECHRGHPMVEGNLYRSEERRVGKECRL